MYTTLFLEYLKSESVVTVHLPASFFSLSVEFCTDLLELLDLAYIPPKTLFHVSLPSQVPELFFSDNETLTLNYTLDPNNLLPRGEDNTVQLIVDVTFDSRDGSEVTVLQSHVINQKVDVTVTVPGNLGRSLKKGVFIRWLNT